jgi:hypothetical protein
MACQLSAGQAIEIWDQWRRQRLSVFFRDVEVTASKARRNNPAEVRIEVSTDLERCDDRAVYPTHWQEPNRCAPGEEGGRRAQRETTNNRAFRRSTGRRSFTGERSTVKSTPSRRRAMSTPHTVNIDHNFNDRDGNGVHREWIAEPDNGPRRLSRWCVVQNG